MSTASEREAALRRALLSAAEQIEPAPGGLERIQQRLGRPRPVLIAQAEAAWTVVLMRAPDVIEALRRRAANVLRLAWDRFGPKSAQGSGPPWLRWVRPLVAMSVAVFVVGAGVYVGLDSPALFAPTGGAGQFGGLGGDSGTHATGPQRNSQGATDGNGTQSVYPGAAGSSPSSSACSKSATPRYPASEPASSTSSAATTPPTSASTGTSPAPTTSGTSTPNPSDSTTPSSGDSGAAPDAGLASGGPAATASDGTSQSTTNSSQRDAGATQSAPSPATTGLSQQSSTKKFNPCKKPKAKHKKTSTASTSAKLMQTQPGRADAAKLD